MGENIIELEGLTKNYGSMKAVDNLSLSIKKGEIFGLLGPNGAGKTTTILMMLGLSEPSAGKAWVCGVDATKNPIAIKRKVGYMPDSLGFYGNMTALENLKYIGRLNGIDEGEVEERAIKTLSLVGLEKEIHKKTAAYSRGMKQRFGLADVLIREPEVIILDEPTLGIDPSGIREFLALIRQLSRQQGLTVLLSSHHLHQVQQVCDRVGIFVEGRLLVQGNIKSLARKLFDEESYLISVSLKNPLPDPVSYRIDLLQLPGVKQVEIAENTVNLSCVEEVTPDIVRFLVHKGLDITGVHLKEFGLDEIYQRYFENQSTNNVSDEKHTDSLQRPFFKRSNH
ncbi:MAG TPA: ABC transporter ATP-binding protein [Cyclobacteriaceae bacterium]|nr:ABC transporter ATP-binding protein [Cyclobacteriaceae bacterium]